MNHKQHTFNLTGIIPVAGQKLEFNFPWHDSLQPIAKDYLAVEHAVAECAQAGCRTIWIVCHDDMQPLIKHRIGQYIRDPVYLKKGQFARFPEEHYKDIPIFYVPIHPDDRDKRDCLAWSVIHGAMVADRVSRSLSNWLAPRKYFVSFPYGINNFKDILKHRKKLTTDRRNVFSFEGKTVQDGLHLPFTFNHDDLKVFKRNVRAKEVKLFKNDPTNPESNRYGLVKLPLQERYSGRFLSLGEVFCFERLEEEEIYTLNWYYDISTWDGYRQYVSSSHSEEIKRPSKTMMKYHELKGYGLNSE